KRTNTAARPAQAPSPWSVRQTALTAYRFPPGGESPRRAASPASAVRFPDSPIIRSPDSVQPAPRLRLLVALRAEHRGGVVEAAVAPRVALGAVAVVVGVGVLDDHVEAAEVAGQLPRLGLREVHQRRVDAEVGAEGEREAALHALDEGEAAVGVARVVRLAHAADEVADAAREAERRRDGQEERVAAGHERRREAGREGVRGIDVARLGEGAAREETGEVEDGQ